MAAAIALVASPPGDDPRVRPWTGSGTPGLAGVDPSGKRIDLRDLKGKVVLVQFWATWCEPCVEELPALGRLRSRFGGRPFEVIAVNVGEGPARVSQFLRDHGVDLPVVLDRERKAVEAWGIRALPTAFLVDAGGRVRSWIFGACSWTGGDPVAELERLVTEAERAGAPLRTPAATLP